MSCCEDRGSWILFQERRYLFLYFLFDKAVVFEEARVDLASFAVVLDFLEVEVFNPVLDVVRSPERNYYHVFILLVADVAGGEGEKTVDVGNLSEFRKGFSVLAVPGL